MDRFQPDIRIGKNNTHEGEDMVSISSLQYTVNLPNELLRYGIVAS